MLKQSWAQKLDREYPHKIVICGGSGVRTSIDGQRMLNQHNLPVLNLGLAAGMGAKTLARYSLKSLKPGDTLLVEIEPDLLTDAVVQEPYGTIFAIATKNYDMLDAGLEKWASALVNCRPNGYHVFTLTGKILLHKPLYRYSQSEIHPSGWQEVGDRREFAVFGPLEGGLSTGGKACLASIGEFCARHGVRVAYLAPWVYYPPDQTEIYQRQTAKFLSDVSQVLPVLEDPSLGVHCVRGHFADTPLHLTTEGAVLRTDYVAQRIKEWRLWTAEDLNRMQSLKH